MQLQSHSYMIVQVLAPILFIYDLPDLFFKYQNVLNIYTLRDLFLKDICTLILL